MNGASSKRISPPARGAGAAVAELSGIPALLAQLDAEEVEALDDPAAEAPPLRPEVLDSLLQKVEWRRRRTRRLSVITLAAAAAVLAVALVVGICPASAARAATTEPMASAVTMSKVAQTPINAAVTLDGFRLGHPDRHGLHLRRLREPRSGDDARTCRWSVVGHNGTQSEIATWVGVNGATALPSGNTTLQKDQIKSVQLVDTDTRAVLLQTESVSRVTD